MRPVRNIVLVFKVLAVLLFFTMCSSANKEAVRYTGNVPDADADTPGMAIFAGGCFWCMEPPFEKLTGVRSVVSGFTGGEEVDPAYNDVAYGRTGHYEAVLIEFDPDTISYNALLDVFWRQIDPTDNEGQFVDRGKHYRAAVFYLNEAQKNEAIASKNRLERSSRFKEPIVTQVIEAGPFYEAEAYHQDYYIKSPQSYKRYRKGSGRDQFLAEHWGKELITHNRHDFHSYKKPSDARLRNRLSSLQYRVTQEDGTEPSFNNAYWDNKKEGLYVDIVSGEVLFSSQEKYTSGTGWPSFTRPLVEKNIVRREDNKQGYPRVEVRSKNADSHLGHVFEDGPEPSGLRYCINSAALRFIPKHDLEAEGYGEWRKHFSQ